MLHGYKNELALQKLFTEKVILPGMLDTLKVTIKNSITIMDITSFKESLSTANPPSNASVYLKALWYDAYNNWNESHKLIQDVADKNASWIHAYLHRKEGDISNADYWYTKAGKKRPSISLQEEWEEIVKAFL